MEGPFCGEEKEKGLEIHHVVYFLNGLEKKGINYPFGGVCWISRNLRIFLFVIYGTELDCI